MFDDIKKELFLKKHDLLFKKGILNKDIVPFNNDFYKKINNTYINGIPVSIYIKYFNDNLCYLYNISKEKYLFYALSDSVLVSANLKILDYKKNIEDSIYSWVEDLNYVYDTNLLLRINKDLFYQMNEPYNVKKISIEDYIKDNYLKNEYYEIKKTTINDYMPDGKKRNDLLLVIPKIKNLNIYYNNHVYENELKKYLKKVKYHEFKKSSKEI